MLIVPGEPRASCRRHQEEGDGGAVAVLQVAAEGARKRFLPNCCWPVADAERKRREEAREKQIEEKQPRMPTRLLGDTS